MTPNEFTGDNLAEVIHKATTGRSDGPDLAKCQNLVSQIRALRCQQNDINERVIPDLKNEISLREARIRQQEADRPRLDLSPPSYS